MNTFEFVIMFSSGLQPSGPWVSWYRAAQSKCITQNIFALLIIGKETKFYFVKVPSITNVHVSCSCVISFCIVVSSNCPADRKSFPLINSKLKHVQMAGHHRKWEFVFSWSSWQNRKKRNKQTDFVRRETAKENRQNATKLQKQGIPQRRSYANRKCSSYPHPTVLLQALTPPSWKSWRTSDKT